VEPVEINAGTCYLRQLRADAVFDDRPVVLAAFNDPELRRWVPDYRVPDLEAAARYIARRTQEWAQDLRCSWAVADPVSGLMLAEVGLKDLDLAAGTAEVACWAHPAHRGRGLVSTAVRAMVRFGFQGLGLRRIDYRHADGNTASQRVAERCGFIPSGRQPRATVIEGRPRDLLVWSLWAGDRDDRHPDTERS